MASLTTTRTLSLLLAYLTIVLLSFSLPSSSRTLTPPKNNKVSLEVYCEAMCPYCSRFYVNNLNPLIQDDELFSIIDLRIIPWGQAEVLSNGTLNCVHGPEECVLNTVHACVINTWPKLEDHYPFVYCTEDLVVKLKSKEWQSCFKKLGKDPRPIMDCASNASGQQMSLEYAAKTNALNPPLDSTPWIVVNGQYVDDFPNFVNYICKAYKGTDPPRACRDLNQN